MTIFTTCCAIKMPKKDGKSSDPFTIDPLHFLAHHGSPEVRCKVRANLQVLRGGPFSGLAKAVGFTSTSETREITCE